MRIGDKFLILVFAVLFINSPSRAEELGTKSGSPTRLEEIVVTGARVETELNDIPQTIDPVTSAIEYLMRELFVSETPQITTALGAALHAREVDSRGLQG
jgi:hypothetical protein